MAEHLPDAWDRDLPANDNLIKAYVWGYADLMESTAEALGWPRVRTDRFVAVDAAERLQCDADSSRRAGPPESAEIFDQRDDRWAGLISVVARA